MKGMLIILVLVIAGGLAYYLLKQKGGLAAQAPMREKKPFWQKVLYGIVGSEHFEEYRPGKPFEPEDIIKDVLDL